MALTAKQARFVEEYLVDLNATQAAIRSGYSAKTAGQIGEENLKKPEIASAVAAAQAKRSARTEITADNVLKEFWEIATADPNELVQFRRGSCNKCWVIEGEAEQHDRLRDPNPDCATCAGEGWGRAFVPDTRSLVGPARKLYAGVKVTKEGIEVKMHDRMAALVNVGRHLGMFTDKTELTGKDGGPVTVVINKPLLPA